MDLTELMTRDGMRDFTSDQRDTFVNDANEIRQIGLIFRARIAQTKIDGDKRWSASLRARKVGRRVDHAVRLLEKAAAEMEALDATYVREVLDLPDRRTKASERKKERKELRELTRAKAQALTGRTLTESAQGLAADPRTTVPSATVPPPLYVHPHAYTTPVATDDPLGSLTDHFGASEAM